MEENTYGLEVLPKMVLKIDERYYRVLHVKDSLVVLCEMNTNKLHLHTMTTQSILLGIVEGNITKADLPSEYGPVVIDALSPAVRESYEKKLQIAATVKKNLGPDYLNLKSPLYGHVLKQCTEDSGFSYVTVLTTIRTFLQSGEDVASLLDGRARAKAPTHMLYKKKPGHPSSAGVIRDDQVLAHLEEALQYYMSNREITQSAAHSRMLVQHYMNPAYLDGDTTAPMFLPENQRPSLRQTTYYINSRLTKEEKDRRNTSAREQRNNRRILHSDNLFDISGPGDMFEIDEVELDLSMRSRLDPDKVVGRAVVYIAIDVFSRMIVAYSISFENNSLAGITNCLMSLLDDKTEVCKRMGITIEPAEWPCRILPTRIRTDYGSEYKSKQFLSICTQLGIERHIVSPAMGSLKGQVEQVFHQIHSAQNPIVSEHGLITKRHDSRHHENAVLNVDQCEKLLLEFIVSHNRQYMEGYPLTRDMMAEGVRPIPVELWRYGCQHYGEPKRITNDEHFLFNLMVPVNVTLNREGIIFEGLKYFTDDAEWRVKMFNEHRTKVKNTFRIDPRDVGTLFYLDGAGHLARASLNSRKTANDFAGFSLKEYLDYRKKRKELDRAGAVYEEERKASLWKKQSDIVHEAIQDNDNHVKNDTEHMKKNRRSEKLDKNQDYSILSRLPTVDESADCSAEAQNDEAVSNGGVGDTPEDFISNQMTSFMKDFRGLVGKKNIESEV